MRAGRTIRAALERKDLRLLEGYEKEWRSTFGDEFRTQCVREERLFQNDRGTAGEIV